MKSMIPAVLIGLSLGTTACLRTENVSSLNKPVQINDLGATVTAGGESVFTMAQADLSAGKFSTAQAQSLAITTSDSLRAAFDSSNMVVVGVLYAGVKGMSCDKLARLKINPVAKQVGVSNTAIISKQVSTLDGLDKVSIATGAKTQIVFDKNEWVNSSGQKVMPSAAPGTEMIMCLEIPASVRAMDQSAADMVVVFDTKEGKLSKPVDIRVLLVNAPASPAAKPLFRASVESSPRR